MEESKEEQQVVHATTQFVSNLYKILSQTEGNIIFSPISIHCILSMLNQGAKGTTAEHLTSTLQVPDAQLAGEGYDALLKRFANIEDISLIMVNKMFLSEKHQQHITDDFNTIIKTKFMSEVQPINFEDNETAAKIINDWVETQTHGEIQNLVDKKMLNYLTRVVLVNAVDFKGGWKMPFYGIGTQPFYINENDTVDVEMMHVFNYFPYKYIDELCVEVILLPYKNVDLTMVVILPYERNGIIDLEKKMETYDLSKLTEDMGAGNMDISLPKFKIENTIDLRESLTELGLGEIFDERNANFGGMMNFDGIENLYVNNAIHKAYIEVDEEGTKAGAATVVSTEMFMSMPTEMIVDHPFVFLVKMRDCIIFMGKVVSP